jgi:hypothetical protein
MYELAGRVSVPIPASANDLAGSPKIPSERLMRPISWPRRDGRSGQGLTRCITGNLTCHGPLRRSYLHDEQVAAARRAHCSYTIGSERAGTASTNR